MVETGSDFLSGDLISASLRKRLIKPSFWISIFADERGSPSGGKLCRAAWVGESVLVLWRGVVVFFHLFNRLDVRFFTSWPFARRSPPWLARSACKVDARSWPILDTALSDAGKYSSGYGRGVPRMPAPRLWLARPL